MSRRRTAPGWLFAVLALPYAVLVNGFVGTVLAYLLRRDGVTVDRIGEIIALVNLPQALYFLWSPLTDFWLRRRNWLVLSSAVAAALLFAAFGVGSFGDRRAIALIFLAVGVAMLTSSCCGGMMAESVAPEQKTRVSSFFQAGALGGGALGGGGLLVLAEHWSRPAVGAVAAVLVVAPALAGQWVAEAPVAASEGLGARLRAMAAEFRRTFLSWRALAPLLLLLAPAGSGAAIGLLPGVAPDYGVSANQVAWINGLLGGLLTAAGAMLVTLLPRNVDARLAYPVAGLVNAACLLPMVLGRPRPFSYLLGAALYLLTVGAAYAFFTALVLQTMGPAGRSGGTRYSMLVSVANLPVAYMAWLDGRGYRWFGTKGVAGMDLVVSGAAALGFVVWWVVAKRRGLLRVLE